MCFRPSEASWVDDTGLAAPKKSMSARQEERMRTSHLLAFVLPALVASRGAYAEESVESISVTCAETPVYRNGQISRTVGKGTVLKVVSARPDFYEVLPGRGFVPRRCVRADGKPPRSPVDEKGWEQAPS